MLDCFGSCNLLLDITYVRCGRHTYYSDIKTGKNVSYVFLLEFNKNMLHVTYFGLNQKENIYFTWDILWNFHFIHNCLGDRGKCLSFEVQLQQFNQNFVRFFVECLYQIRALNNCRLSRLNNDRFSYAFEMKLIISGLPLPIQSSIWVFQKKSSVQFIDSNETSTYCDQLLYMFSFVILIMQVVTFGLLCCCACCSGCMLGVGAAIVADDEE